RGLFHENDVSRLRELGEYIRKTFAVNLALDADITSDKDNGYDIAGNVREDTYDSYYKPFDGENEATLSFRFDKPQTVTHVVLKEHIPMSQRIEKFSVEAKDTDGKYIKIASGTTVGYKKILKFDPYVTDEIRIHILDSRVCPIISFVGIY
nr:alpha-fucosidase [Clostridiales bacterium]